MEADSAGCTASESWTLQGQSGCWARKGCPYQARLPRRWGRRKGGSSDQRGLMQMIPTGKHPAHNCVMHAPAIDPVQKLGTL